jgi:hypothetical protein
MLLRRTGEVMPALAEKTKKQTEKDLDEAIRIAKQLGTNAAKSVWEYAKHLNGIFQNQLWKQRKDAKGQPIYTTIQSFGSFVEKELGITKTHAYRMIRVAETYTETQIKGHSVSNLILMLKVPDADRNDLLEKSRGKSSRDVDKEVKSLVSKHKNVGTELLDDDLEEESESDNLSPEKEVGVKKNLPLEVSSAPVRQMKDMIDNNPIFQEARMKKLPDGSKVSVEDWEKNRRVSPNSEDNIILCTTSVPYPFLYSEVLDRKLVSQVNVLLFSLDSAKKSDGNLRRANSVGDNPVGQVEFGEYIIEFELRSEATGSLYLQVRQMRPKGGSKKVTK